MDTKSRAKSVSTLTAVLIAVMALPVLVADTPKQLPDPDGRPANMSKPVKVFILLGQSNMLGFGKIGAGDKPGSLTRGQGERQVPLPRRRCWQLDCAQGRSQCARHVERHR